MKNITTIGIIFILFIFIFLISINDRKDIPSQPDSTQLVLTQSIVANPVSEVSKTDTNTMKKNREDWDNAPVLYVEFIRGQRVEILSVEEFDNGDAKIIVQRWPSGTIAKKHIGVPNGSKAGYNFNYRNGAYSDYDIATLKELASQEDKDAQLMLAHKLLRNNRRDDSIPYFFAAASNGYTAGFDQLALNYMIEGDNTTAYAYKLLAYENAPDNIRIKYDRFGNRLSDDSRARALDIANQLIKSFE